ncbi:MAG: hypothetical protein ACM3JG_17105 [Thiohalocapsa sp.]
MILLVMGLPGRFAEWCAGVLARLAAPAGPAVTLAWPPIAAMLGYQPVPSILEELGAVLVANVGGDGERFVVNACQPDDPLRDVLAAREIPFVVALDDPEAAIADVTAATGAVPRQLVRALANSYPFLMPYAALPGAFVLTAEEARADPAAAVAAIAAHVDLAIPRRRARAIAAQLAASGLSPSPQRAADLPPEVAKMLAGALLPYHRQFVSGTLGEIVWTRELFLLEALGSPCGPIDVAGGPRNLIFGPYIHLPPGDWRARVVLGLSPETPGTVLVVDAFADSRQLGLATLAPTRGGVHVADIAFTIEEPSRQGLEIRILVASAVSHGRLAFGHVVPQLRGGAGPQAIDASDDFEAVLAL